MLGSRVTRRTKTTSWTRSRAVRRRSPSAGGNRAMQAPRGTWDGFREFKERKQSNSHGLQPRSDRFSSNSIWDEKGTLGQRQQKDRMNLLRKAYSYCVCDLYVCMYSASLAHRFSRGGPNPIGGIHGRLFDTTKPGKKHLVLLLCVSE